MNPLSAFDFDFDFSGVDRAELLAEASNTVRALGSELGPGTLTGESAADAASNLLSQLNEEVAQFSTFPGVLPLDEKNFTEHGMEVPRRFQDLIQKYKFYWLHFPITLSPLQNMPFVKLQCAVEFNPGVTEGHLRPLAHMIFPDRKFQQLLELSDSLELGIDENFEFNAGTGKLEGQAGLATAKGEAGVGAKAKGKLGLVIGPFKHTWKKAQIEHSPAGTEKVFWRVSGAEFFQEDTPTFIVVLQLPKAVNDVQIAAALQAYHQPNIWAMGPGEGIKYFTQRLATFFRKGAPMQDTQVWNITHSL
jgi:hypothetical protein